MMPKTHKNRKQNEVINTYSSSNKETKATSERETNLDLTFMKGLKHYSENIRKRLTFRDYDTDKIKPPIKLIETQREEKKQIPKTHRRSHSDLETVMDKMKVKRKKIRLEVIINKEVKSFLIEESENGLSLAMRISKVFHLKLKDEYVANMGRILAKRINTVIKNLRSSNGDEEFNNILINLDEIEEEKAKQDKIKLRINCNGRVIISFINNNPSLEQINSIKSEILTNLNLPDESYDIQILERHIIESIIESIKNVNNN